jgi:DNA-binding beta-propeller fold protein YncE|tara:strand:- start:1879 stop:2976 length:1098 start_codon:yes stop_codon:yes gene_type:complete
MNTLNENLSRRSFLKSTVLASAAVSGPFVLNACSKSGTKRPRVGSGEHTYEVYHDWGMDSLPSDHTYGGASHGIAVDAEGLVYITHHGTPGSIFVFDPDGKFIKSFAGVHHAKGKDGKIAAKGHGIDIRKEGNQEFAYLSPNDSSLFFSKMTLDGEMVWNRDRAELDEASDRLGEKVTFRPTNASFRPDGGYYLGDGYGSNWIFEYDKNDRFVRAIGGKGKADGQFATPHGQWLDDRDGTPKLVVADRANKRLQWFGMDGKHIKTQDGFLFPADIDVQGDLMLVPDLHARITLLNLQNEVIAHLGDDEGWRAKVLDKGIGMRTKRNLWEPGKFIHPHDACFDSNGDILVAEWVVTGRVSKLVKVG